MTYIGCHLDVPGKRGSKTILDLGGGGGFNGGHQGGYSLNSPPWIRENPPVSTPHTNVILCRRVQYYTNVIRSSSCLETKSRVIYKTIFLWPVVQNWVIASPSIDKSSTVSVSVLLPISLP